MRRVMSAMLCAIFVMASAVAFDEASKRHAAGDNLWSIMFLAFSVLALTRAVLDAIDTLIAPPKR